MKFLAFFIVGVVALLLPGGGNAWVLHGPHGEVADENTDVIWVEDDDGVPVKGYLASPNVSYAIPPLMLRSGVRFYLWTQSTAQSGTGEQLYLGEEHNLRTSSFNPLLPTKILIHGFRNTIRSPVIQKPRKAYLARGNYNVIGVDWGDHCGGFWYDIAKDNTVVVGRYVGEMIQFLMEKGGARAEDIHIIGHSLGAHVSGNAGYNIRGDRVARVTGLDPARPFFSTTPPEDKLDPTDARYVDVIHTCGGYLGLMERTGMADFYPNGGTVPQPGCTSYFGVKSFSSSCSHSKAHEFWTHSIDLETSGYEARECNTVDEAMSHSCTGDVRGAMGEYSDHSMRGIFYLSTD